MTILYIVRHFDVVLSRCILYLQKNAYLGHLDIKVLELLWTKLIKIFRKNTIYILLTSKINKIQKKKIILQILLISRSPSLVILPYHLKKLATILKALRFKNNTNLKGRFFVHSLVKKHRKIYSHHFNVENKLRNTLLHGMHTIMKDYMQNYNDLFWVTIFYTRIY